MIIAFEGLDNSGKTTQAEIIQSYLTSYGKSAILSRELTTDVGILLKSSFNEKPYSALVKSYLFAADRQIRIEEIQLHKNYQNSIIIFDRYKHSAIAYRESEGLDANWISIINKYVLPYDVGIYIDITPEESIRRNNDRKKNIHYDINQLRHIRDIYSHYVSEGELKLINGMLSINEITKQIINYIEGFISG